MTVIFDSELVMSSCICHQSQCTCKVHSVPLKCTFNESGLAASDEMDDIKQRKGEAEMAVVDWIYELAVHMKDDDILMSVITSGDIDAVVNHLFALSVFWPKFENGKYRNPVYVQLVKPGGHFDLYNVTGILELLQATFSDPNIGLTFSMSLCLGGNDFLPKFRGITHSRLMQAIFSDSKIREDLFQITMAVNHPTGLQVNSDMYLHLLKCLYCPKGVKASELTYDEVRQMTINPNRVRRKDVPAFRFTTEQANLRDPWLWLPPSSCMLKMCSLINCMAEYLFCAGRHDADLPDFSKTCLSVDGKTYELGEDMNCRSVDELLTSALQESRPALSRNDKSRVKRRLDLTPKKQSQKRKPMCSTPKKL